ncbi:MAG: hypothetical protein JJT89_18105 [Nitriliruptoraceae bacterium]|nr:hypothetical protein [Nitriliruptoraceae bacterium]
MAEIPGKAESQREFTTLSSPDRRLIIRAVNKGQPVDNRRHAHMAVWIARRQVRFWRYAWFIGPMIGVAQLFTGLTPEQVLVNAGGATAFLLLLSAFWTRRARRAEVLNLELAQKGRRRAKKRTPPAEPTERRDPFARFRRSKDGGADDGASTGKGKGKGKEAVSGSSGSRPRGHLPGEVPGRPRPAGGDASGTSTGTSSERTTGRAQDTPAPPPGQRPYKPRGRKRR